MRVIDVNKQLVRLYRLNLFCEDTIKQFLLSADTVDAEPVRHGKWLAVKGWDDEIGELDSAECSVCHETQEDEYWAKTYYKYCPNCGAKMDLNEVENG